MKMYKVPEFYMIFARKIFFPNFEGAGALALPPVSYAGGLGRQRDSVETATEGVRAQGRHFEHLL